MLSKRLISHNPMSESLCFHGWKMVFLVLFVLSGCSGHRIQHKREYLTLSPFPQLHTARFAIRSNSRRQHAEWEACWLSPSRAYMAWYGPFGQLLSAAWLENNRVDWLNPGEKIHAWWTNTSAGWQAVFGIPLKEQDILLWFLGLWSPELYGATQREVNKNGLSFLFVSGQIDPYHVEIYRHLDGRLWQVSLKTPWETSIRMEYRYKESQQEPIQIIWRWTQESNKNISGNPSDGPPVFWMRWDGFQAKASDCQLPDFQRVLSNEPDWETWWIEASYDKTHPFIIDLLLGSFR